MSVAISKGARVKVLKDVGSCLSGDFGTITRVSIDVVLMRLDRTDVEVGFSPSYLDEYLALVESPSAAKQIDRAIADRALVTRDGKIGRMNARHFDGGFTVHWEVGGGAAFIDADFGTKVHPCDAGYLYAPSEPAPVVPTDPRDAEIARLKSELAAATSKGSAMDGRTLSDALGTVATQRARIRVLEAEEERTSFALASKDREIAKLKLAVKEGPWRR